jgi:hypothetical protein
MNGCKKRKLLLAEKKESKEERGKSSSPQKDLATQVVTPSLVAAGCFFCLVADNPQHQTVF